MSGEGLGRLCDVECPYSANLLVPPDGQMYPNDIGDRSPVGHIEKLASNENHTIVIENGQAHPLWRVGGVGSEDSVICDAASIPTGKQLEATGWSRKGS